MKIAIVGAGAIGGWVGAKLAAAGDDVSFLARGETLEALQRRGIGLQEGDTVRFHDCTTTDSSEEIGEQDVLIIAVKAQALPDLAPSLASMIGSSTLVVPMLNGVPWWFMDDAMPLTSIDPDATIAKAIARQNILGCVVHAAATSPEKGISQLHFCDRIILGEPDGPMTARLGGLRDHFEKAGITAVASSDVRSEIWFKLWGNMTMNPMSALTLATMDKLLDDVFVRELAMSAMAEARRIGERIGCPISQSGEERMQMTRKLGAFKTSMLQDVEAGKSLELDALLAAPIEIADAFEIDVPTLRGLFGLARVMARSRGLY